MEPLHIDNADYFSDHFAIIGQRLLDILYKGHKEGHLSLETPHGRKTNAPSFF